MADKPHQTPAGTITGGMAEAPHHEISQPLQRDAGAVHYADGTVLTPLDKARANERELAPLTYGKVAGASAATTEAPKLDPFYARRVSNPSGVTGKDPEGLDPFYTNLVQRRKHMPAEPAASQAATQFTNSRKPATEPTTTATPIRRILRRGIRPAVPQEIPDGSADRSVAARVVGGAIGGDAARHDDLSPDVDGGHDPVSVEPLAVAPPTDDEVARMPAASTTDSPVRGVPRLPARTGLEVTAGFGDPAGLQYYALNGLELFKLIERLMDEVYGRAQNDLRFNEAICYPQVTARVVVEIKGFVSDNDFLVDRVLLPDDPAVKTNPIEFCRKIADEVAFVLLAERRETNDEGEPELAPGQIREELGLQQPRKQRVPLGKGDRQVVDLV